MEDPLSLTPSTKKKSLRERFGYYEDKLLNYKGGSERVVASPLPKASWTYGGLYTQALRSAERKRRRLY